MDMLPRQLHAHVHGSCLSYVCTCPLLFSLTDMTQTLHRLSLFSLRYPKARSKPPACNSVIPRLCFSDSNRARCGPPTLPFCPGAGRRVSVHGALEGCPGAHHLFADPGNRTPAPAAAFGQSRGTAGRGRCALQIHGDGQVGFAGFFTILEALKLPGGLEGLDTRKESGFEGKRCFGHDYFVR